MRCVNNYDQNLPFTINQVCGNWIRRQYCGISRHSCALPGQAVWRLTGACLNTGHTVLMWAAVKGHSAFVSLLLDAGANVDLLDNMGDNAARLAEQYRQTAIVELFADRETASGALGGCTQTLPPCGRLSQYKPVFLYLKG